MKHENLTRKVINLLLNDNDILLNQFNHSTISEENDDVGYYANFSVDKTQVEVFKEKLPSRDVVGKTKDGKNIVGFVLFIKDGYLDCLEGYTFGNEKWPDLDEDISLEIN